MSLTSFVAHRSSNDKCPELPAGQFFSGAQIPRFLLMFGRSTLFVVSLQRNSISTSPASSIAVRKVAVICELKYESVSGVTHNYLIVAMSEAVYI